MISSVKSLHINTAISIAARIVHDVRMADNETERPTSHCCSIQLPTATPGCTRIPPKKIKFPHNVFETRPSTRHPYPALQTNKIIFGPPPPPSKFFGSAHERPMDKENWKNTCNNKEKGVLRVNKHDWDIHVHYRHKSIWLYIHSSLHIGYLVDGIDKTYITFVVIWPQSLKQTVSLKMAVVI